MPGNWDEVDFVEWNPPLSDYAKCGIEVVNNKLISVHNCYAELISVYEEMEGKYSQCALTPCSLPWIINRKKNYEKIEIEPTKHKFIGLTFPTVGINDFQLYAVVGQGFNYPWNNTGRVIIELEVSGKIENQTIKPKKMFATVLRTGNRFTVTEIKNAPPENVYKE